MDTTKYIFKNGKRNDLRRQNMEIFHNYDIIMREQYDITEYIQGSNSCTFY
jgi:hypothetical protein